MAARKWGASSNTASRSAPPADRPSRRTAGSRSSARRHKDRSTALAEVVLPARAAADFAAGRLADQAGPADHDHRRVELMIVVQPPPDGLDDAACLGLAYLV